MDEQIYTKILIAKYAPEFGLDIPDGEILTIKPRKSPPKKDAHYHFIGTQHPKLKVKLGWVAETDPFTQSEFIEKYHPNEVKDDSELEHIRTMLSSIQKLPVGTTVAATYSERGILNRRVEITVHKVVSRGDSPI